MSEFNPLVQPTVYTEPPKGAQVVLGDQLSKHEQVWLQAVCAELGRSGSASNAMRVGNVIMNAFKEKFGTGGCISNVTQLK